MMFDMKNWKQMIEFIDPPLTWLVALSISVQLSMFLEDYHSTIRHYLSTSLIDSEKDHQEKAKTQMVSLAFFAKDAENCVN